MKIREFFWPLLDPPLKEGLLKKIDKEQNLCDFEVTYSNKNWDVTHDKTQENVRTITLKNNQSKIDLVIENNVVENPNSSILVSKSKKNYKKISIDDISILDKDINITYNLALSYFEKEEERKNSIESKSTIFIGTLGVTITIILAISKLLSENFTFNNAFLLTILVLVSLYLCRAVWFSIKVLERRSYNCLSHKDFVTNENKQYLKGLIVKLVNATNNNSSIINEKVDYMTMAQEYFKRAIVTIIICNFLFLFFYIINNSFCLSEVSILFKNLFNHRLYS